MKSKSELNIKRHLKIYTTVFLLIFLCSFKKENKLNKDKLSLVVFVSPTCPICQYYCYGLNKLKDSLNIQILAIVPSSSYIHKNEITAFVKDFNPEFSLIIDSKKKYIKKYKPEITPEFYLVRNDSVLYRGAFDDKYIDIGSKRYNVQNNYLYNAIYAIKNNLPYEKKTQSVGCIISQ